MELRQMILKELEGPPAPSKLWVNGRAWWTGRGRNRFDPNDYNIL